MPAELINQINWTVLSFRKLKIWAVHHDFFVIAGFFFMCLGAGGSDSISPRLGPTGHVVASKLSSCLNPCYFSWTAFSSGSVLLRGVAVLFKGCQAWFSFTLWQHEPSHPLEGPFPLPERWNEDLSLQSMDLGGGHPHRMGLCVMGFLGSWVSLQSALWSCWMKS